MATAYSNFNGNGNRVSTIRISDRGSGLIHNNPANWVDGTTSSGTAWFNITSAGILVFDFFESVVIDEITFYQDSATAQGTWQWSGSNDDTTYTNIGGTVVLSSATQVISTLSGNTTAYRWYKMTQTAGSTNNGPNVREFEFKIGYSGTPTYAIGYANGAGNRTVPSIVLTTGSLGGTSGAIGLLKDGASFNGDNPSNAVFWGNGQTSLQLDLDFGSARAINKIIWLDDVVYTETARYKWQVSNNGSTYTDVTSSLNSTFGIGNEGTNGGGYSIHDVSSSNPTSYRYWRMVCTSGTVTNQAFFRELLFAIDANLGPSDVTTITMTLAGFGFQTVVNKAAAPGTGKRLWWTS